MFPLIEPLQVSQHLNLRLHRLSYTVGVLRSLGFNILLGLVARMKCRLGVALMKSTSAKNVHRKVPISAKPHQKISIVTGFAMSLTFKNVLLLEPVTGS